MEELFRGGSLLLTSNLSSFLEKNLVTYMNPIKIAESYHGVGKGAVNIFGSAYNFHKTCISLP